MLLMHCGLLKLTSTNSLICWARDNITEWLLTKILAKLGLWWDFYEQIFFSFDMMMDTTKHHIFIPVWMALTLFQGHRDIKKPKLICTQFLTNFLTDSIQTLWFIYQQEELTFLLRKLVLYFRQLPAQTAHSIFNYLVCGQVLCTNM